jgi:hypothetical protein
MPTLPFDEKGDGLFHSLRYPLERQDVILPQARIEQLPGHPHPSPVHVQEPDTAGRGTPKVSTPKVSGLAIKHLSRALTMQRREHR